MSLAMETAEANAVLTRSREQREAAQRELESIEADLYTPALLRAAASDLAEHARIRERIQRFREFAEERTASEEELDDLLTRSTRTIRGDLHWLVFTGLAGIVGIFCCLMSLLWPRGSALFFAFVASLIVTGGLAEATTDPILRHLGTRANIAWRLMILLPMTIALGVAVWLGPAIEVVP